MRITRKFLQLTKKTYPHGTESQLEKYLPTGYIKDEYDNYYLVVGENPSTMFTCHLDTACSTQSDIKHVFDGNFIKTDGTTVLSADDKAGMTILLYMIKKEVPGLYYFFVGEECGCVGSGKVSRTWTSNPLSENITKVVSFDRRGTDSIITEQWYGVCCSNEFAKELATRLNSVDSTFNYRPDPTGIYTDSAKFTGLVPECTNISVGYYGEHGYSERQDIEHLKKLCKAVVKIDWETLPIKRTNVSKYDFDYLDDDYDYSPGTDDAFPAGFTSSNYTHVDYQGKVVKALISEDRIKEEEEQIKSWMVHFGLIEYSAINWNGDVLYGVSASGQEDMIGTRVDLVNYIEDLSAIPLTDLFILE
jgi:hypothetical protein